MRPTPRSGRTSRSASALSFLERPPATFDALVAWLIQRFQGLTLQTPATVLPYGAEFTRMLDECWRLLARAKVVAPKRGA